MNEREIGEALLDLCRTADRMRAPSHRHTIETYHADREEIRDGLRKLYRRVFGVWPGEVPSGPAKRPGLPMPTALARHRERVAGRRATA